MGKPKHFDYYDRFRESYPEYQVETRVKEVQTADNYRIVLTLIRNQVGYELIRHSEPLGPYDDIKKLKRLVESLAIEKFFKEIEKASGIY